MTNQYFCDNIHKQKEGETKMEEVNIKELLETIKEKIWIVGIALLISIITTIVYINAIKEPIYKSSTTYVLVSNNEEIMRDLFMLSNEEQYSHSEIDVILYESIQKLGNKYKNVILTSLKVKNNKEGAKLLNYTDRYYAKMLCVSRKLLRERILKHHLVLENMR